MGECMYVCKWEIVPISDYSEKEERKRNITEELYNKCYKRIWEDEKHRQRQS